MARLFVALDLPHAVTTKLVAHQPRPCSGIRLIPPSQMHLTLHFIGEAMELLQLTNAPSERELNEYMPSVKR